MPSARAWVAALSGLVRKRNWIIGTATIKKQISRNQNITSIYILLCGALLIGFAPIFAKKSMVIGGVSPIGAGFWRMAFGACVLAFLLPVLSRSQMKSLRSVAFSKLGILAGLFFAMDLCLWHTSFNYTSIANASMLANLSSLMVPIASAFFLGETLSKKFMLGALIAFSGVASLMIGSGLQPLPGSTPAQQWLGDGLALTTAFCYMGYLLVVKKTARSLGPLVISLVSSTWSALFIFLFGLMRGESILPERSEGWMYLVCLGVISHAMGQGFVALSLKNLPVSLTSVLLLIAPTASAIFGVWFLKQNLSLMHLLGCVLVVCGIALAMKSKSQRP